MINMMIIVILNCKKTVECFPFKSWKLFVVRKCKCVSVLLEQTHSRAHPPCASRRRVRWALLKDTAKSLAWSLLVDNFVLRGRKQCF
ncbi:hypothetical protein F2P79_007649 [Pimephales promelas]|nr:hypothetical protein F2P79_007649 [Pimephales promelas]